MIRKIKAQLVVTFFVVFSTHPVTALALPYYSILDLGNGSLSSINDRGDVGGELGIWKKETGWQDTGFEVLDINNSGDAVGNSYIRSNETTTDLGFYTRGINDNGEVVGYRDEFFDEFGLFLPSAKFWNNTEGVVTISDNKVGQANDINNNGLAVGRDHGENAFLWNSISDFVLQFQIAGGEVSEVIAINDSGYSVGHSWGTLDVGGFGAALLSSDGNIEVNLHKLAEETTGKDIETFARGINNDNWSVISAGDTPLLWHNGLMDNLNDLIETNSGWELIDVQDINNFGQIIGSGKVDGETHSFLLNPEWYATVLIDQTYLTDYIILEDTLSLDYWWKMGVESSELNIDVLARGGTRFETIGLEFNLDGSSTDWATAFSYIPEWARGMEARILFSLIDGGQNTEPTVYLRNIASNDTAPVPEPTTMLLLGTGFAITAVARLRKK